MFQVVCEEVQAAWRTCQCAMNAQDALEVFGKVRESLNDSSVYVNIGHMHYAWDEFDRVTGTVSVCCHSSVPMHSTL